jgi:hypothetical protein
MVIKLDQNKSADKRLHHHINADGFYNIEKISKIRSLFYQVFLGSR